LDGNGSEVINRTDNLSETVEPSLVNQQLVSKYRRRLTTLVELQWKETSLVMLDQRYECCMQYSE